MNQFKGIDHWGVHVYPWYKCSNPNCDNKCEDIEDYMIITYRNVRREEEERLKKYYLETNKKFSLQEVLTQNYFYEVEEFYCNELNGSDRCRIDKEGALQLYVDEECIDIDGKKLESGWICCNITLFWLNAKFKLTR